MKLCAICGVRPANTADHIPPKGLYTKPYPKNLHTVPACSNCNQGGSAADEIVKIMICLSSGESRTDSQQVLTSMQRTLIGNKKLQRKVMSSAHPTYHRFNGRILRPAIAVRFEAEPYREVMTRIVRALYWVEKKSALGLAAKVTVEPFGQIKDPAIAANFKALMDSLEPRPLNESTFIYKVFFDEAGSSIWGFSFFSDHISMATAEAPARFATQPSSEV